MFPEVNYYSNISNNVRHLTSTVTKVPVRDGVRWRIAHPEPVPNRNPKPVIPERRQAVDVASDASNLFVDLEPVTGRVLGHLDDVVGSKVGSKRKSWDWKRTCLDLSDKYGFMQFKLFGFIWKVTRHNTPYSYSDKEPVE